MVASRKQLQESLDAANRRLRFYESVHQLLRNRGHEESLNRAMEDVSTQRTEVARVLRGAGMPTSVVEENPPSVDAARHVSEPTAKYWGGSWVWPVDEPGNLDVARHVFRHLDRYPSETVTQAVAVLREAGELPPEQPEAEPEPRHYYEADLYADEDDKVRVMACPDCGAVIWSSDDHDAWHAAQ